MLLASGIFPVRNSYAILPYMESESMVVDLSPDRLDRLQKRVVAFSSRLRAARLDGIAEVLLEVSGPLGPLGAQVLWVAQPALGLLLPADEIDGLARVLESPAGMNWLREALIGHSQTDGQG